MGFSLFKLPTEIQSRVLHLIQSPDLRTILSIKQFHPLIADNVVFMAFTDTKAINCESYFPCDGKLFKDVNISDPESLVEVSQTLKSNKIVLLDMFTSRPDVSTLTPQTLEFITAIAKTNTVHLAYHSQHQQQYVGMPVHLIGNLIAIITQLTFPNNVSLILEIGRYLSVQYESLPADVYFPKIFLFKSSIELLSLQANQCSKLEEIVFYGAADEVNIQDPSPDYFKVRNLDYGMKRLQIYRYASFEACSLINKKICSPTFIDINDAVLIKDVVFENCENLSLMIHPVSTGEFGISGLRAPKLNELFLGSDSQSYEELTLEAIDAPEVQILRLHFRPGCVGPSVSSQNYPNVKTGCFMGGNIKLLSSFDIFLLGRIIGVTSLYQLEVWDCHGSFTDHDEQMRSKLFEIFGKWDLPFLRYLSLSGFDDFPPLQAKNLEALNINSPGCIALDQIRKHAPKLVHLTSDSAAVTIGALTQLEFPKLRFLKINVSQAPKDSGKLYDDINNISFPKLEIFDYAIQASRHEEFIDFQFDAPSLRFIKLRILVPQDHKSECREVTHLKDSKFEYDYTISMFPMLRHVFIPSPFKNVQISKCPSVETVQAYNPTYDSKCYLTVVPRLRLLNLGPIPDAELESFLGFPIDMSGVMTIEKARDSEHGWSSSLEIDPSNGYLFLNVAEFKEISNDIDYRDAFRSYHARVIKDLRADGSIFRLWLMWLFNLHVQVFEVTKNRRDNSESQSNTELTEGLSNTSSDTLDFQGGTVDDNVEIIHKVSAATKGG
ncbi:hypothetical protein WICPIJ_008308 [Wickerhamomyces pijperi]|uniref:F-box domain-containing protein n=1 Tax=Wickerhamomyces pijperi TaxID=599730 RepID=A0A9P8PXN2_WICPI|nr:hypothetical protein WICPIJ_008308 [Wickerhamomyces pijperi]